MSELTRRRLIQSGLVAAASASFGPVFWRDAFAAPPTVAAPGPYGPLLPPDANGLHAPVGVHARGSIARGDQVMPGRGYVFPRARTARPVTRRPTAAGSWPRTPRSAGGARRRVRDPLRRRRDDRRLLPDPRRDERQLRRRPDAVGHVAVVRGGATAARSGNATRPATRRPSPGRRDGLVQARGVLRRPGQRARLPQRGRRRRLLLPLRAGRLSGSLGRHARRSRAPASSRARSSGSRCSTRTPCSPPRGRRCAPRSRPRSSTGAARGCGSTRASSTSSPPRTTRSTPTTPTTGAISVLYEAAAVPGTPLTDPDNIHVSARSRDVFVAEDKRRRRPASTSASSPPTGNRSLPEGHGPRSRQVRGDRAHLQPGRYAVLRRVAARRHGVGDRLRDQRPVPPVHPAAGPARRRPRRRPAPGFPLGLTIARRISIATLIRRGLAIALTLDKASTVRFRLRARVTVKGKRKTGDARERRRAGRAPARRTCG